ncbi:amino acid ABC transporter permease [Limosilactobacillus equigenerosi]|uniref:Polar amino acid ABC transporter inner membrane protein n=1 Tax=Limosilactobacillus equigenerosi DSM 18793 = JCM 14505 TaxID=1423742 RepID=A0A0R1UYA9_9LACO|nr:amino acid ABC transporter permease [Limosilactobacillus equigenerosi]KRL96275.1 polar amino acid ABC transporter inner membrane protein [Limosilactobacillus equigenerosi DSM 18793 = JCM 14505]
MWETITDAVPQLLAAGFKYTIPLAIVSFFFGLILALITALIRMSKQGGVLMVVRWLFSFYVWLFRSTPLLVQLFIVFFGLPYLKIKGIAPDGIKLEPFFAGVLTFSLNTGAYASETLRSAISSVPKEQWEAGAAIGMTQTQVFRRIILPQALRVAVPPLSNEFISLVKDTSLAASITIIEMFNVSQQIAAENYQPLLMYSIVALIYAVFTTVLSYLQSYLERVLNRQMNVN